jgi:hypothetical protein
MQRRSFLATLTTLFGATHAYRHAAHDPGGRVTPGEVVNGLTGTDRFPVALPLCCGSCGAPACRAGA